MCPEPGLISAYVDGEVPSPWKERIASHLEQCSDCAARAARYAKLHAALSSGDESLDVDASVARVSARLAGRLDGVSGSLSGLGRSSAPSISPRPNLWARSIRLPMPLVAAAALALVFLAGLAASGLVRGPRTPVQTLAATEIAPSSSKQANMETLIHYLESQNAQVNLTIQLPSGASFDSTGKPVVVRASDASYAPQTTNDGGIEGSGH